MNKEIKCAVVFFTLLVHPVSQASETQIDKGSKKETSGEASMKMMLDTKDEHNNFNENADVSYPDPCRFVQCPETNNKEEN